jgi:putative phage-type endonuclease
VKLLLDAGQVEADRSRWLEVRRRGVTASEIAAIMGVPGAYGTASSVYYEKTAGYEQDDSLSMRIGRHFEGLVGEIFAEQHRELAVADGGLYAADGQPWAMATFDRLARHLWRPPVPVQIKTSATYDGYGPDGSDEVPPHYLAQDLWEMHVSGAAEVWMPVLFTNGRSIRTYRIARDADADADIAVMLAEAEAFLERVARAEPPPVDWRPQTTRALKRVYADAEDRDTEIPDALRDELRAAKAAQKAGDKRWGQAENELRAAMGKALRAVDSHGDRVAFRSLFSQQRIDVKRLRADWPAAAAACAKSSPVDRINLTRE